MKSREFNSFMPSFHHQWTANALGMNVNPGRGPDLIGKDKFAELLSATNSN